MSADALHSDPGERPSPPAMIVAQLDGSDLESKTGVSVGVMTSDPDGWPRPAHLSAGEVLLSADGEVRLALHPHSSTTENVRRTGRIVLTVVADGADHELRFTVIEGPPMEDPPLATFKGRLVVAREHRAPYADVMGGISFRLHDVPETLERWRRQIAALRAL